MMMMMKVLWCIVWVHLCVISQLVCASSEDRCLHIFSTPSGRRLCPAILLPSSISRLLCSAVYVMVVTSRAGVFVWFVYCGIFLDPEGGSPKPLCDLLLVLGISSLKIPKASVIHSTAQRNFAHTFMLIFHTDLPLRFSADITPSFL